MTKVLIVEDQKMARDTMARYIDSSENYTLVGAITNAAMAELFCAGHEVDLILMDVYTEHDESGLEAAAVIKKRFPHIKIIIVTSMAECSFIEKAHAAAADSFWYKEVSNEELLSVMDRTMNGETVYPKKTPEVKLGLTTSYQLTEAELKTLRAIMESADYREAAVKLGCSESNIRFHLNNILDKTGYRNRFELCMAVAQKNLIMTAPDKLIDDC